MGFPMTMIGIQNVMISYLIDMREDHPFGTAMALVEPAPTEKEHIRIVVMNNVSVNRLMVWRERDGSNRRFFEIWNESS